MPIYQLTPEGKEYFQSGLPERNLIKFLSVKDKATMAELSKAKNFSVAIQWAKRNGWIKVSGNFVELSEAGRAALAEKSAVENAIEILNAGDSPKEEDLKILLERKLAEEKRERMVFTEKEITKITPEVIRVRAWENVPFRKYDVSVPVQKIFPGRRHFVSQAVEYARKVWLEMGFKEMEGPLVQLSFWNFDALFTAQDHPVRELHDTFFVQPEKGRLPEKKLVEEVKRAHEAGIEESQGWGGEWNLEIAKKFCLRTHTTCLSAKTLASLKKEDLPAKYFAVGRCFRNETVDWKHGFEFNQSEGIVVDENANFKNLLGYLKQFYSKMGFPNPRFRPAYFPYTEMSVGIEVFHPIHKKWVELGGAGIFRPEVVVPLLGKDIPVLAWGPGFDRLVMDYYKIQYFRDMYANDLKVLRGVHQWMK